MRGRVRVRARGRACTAACVGGFAENGVSFHQGRRWHRELGGRRADRGFWDVGGAAATAPVTMTAQAATTASTASPASVPVVEEDKTDVGLAC